MAIAASAAPTRRERRKQEVRGRILDAAVALFDAQGFDATTVAQISERADVAHKTLFNHFPSKQDLLRAIAQQSLDELLERIEEARLASGPMRERLLRFFIAVADNAEHAGPMRRELLTEIIHAANFTGTEAEQSRKLHEAFGAIVREGRAAGDISRDHSLQAQTELVVGTFYVLMLNWAHLEGYPLRRRAVEAARLLGDALAGVQGAGKP